jgi:hypothetical protein
MNKNNNRVLIEIKSDSEIFDRIRENGVLFEIIAGALGVKISEVKEIEVV